MSDSTIDYDFSHERLGGVATITTNNWATTQWLRDNAGGVGGTVTGENYATATGDAGRVLLVAQAMLDAGFTCSDSDAIGTLHAVRPGGPV